MKTRVLQRVGEDDERYKVVGECEPGEDEVEELVEHLDVDPEFAQEGVGGAVDVVKVDCAVHGGEEGAV